jgi:hypothetical protein
MFSEISYYLIFGKPLIMYLGILTLLSLLTTASIAFLTISGIRRFPMQWHHRGAALTIIFALVHGILGILLYF